MQIVLSRTHEVNEIFSQLMTNAQVCAMAKKFTILHPCASEVRRGNKYAVAGSTAVGTSGRDFYMGLEALCSGLLACPSVQYGLLKAEA